MPWFPIHALSRIRLFRIDLPSVVRNSTGMRLVLSSAFLLASIFSPATAGITFGPVRAQPGESVRLLSHSETPGGTVEISNNGKTSKGTISSTRERELVWTVRAPAPDGTKRGMVRVPAITTTTITKIAGKNDTVTDASPLNGKMFSMSKSPSGEWKFELDGSVPYTRSQSEIEELTVYLKREWFPKKEVNLGDSWEFDPAWIKMIVEKDLSQAKTIGTMRLRQIRRGEKRQIAVIDVTIRSTGGDFKADGSETAASVDLSGQLTVNLDTMLDESLELKGTINIETNKTGETRKVKLPVNLTVNKSFIQDTMTP
jgi:hypothetical protein